MLVAEIRARIFMKRLSLQDLFKRMDTSGNGDLDSQELYDGFKETLNSPWTVEQVKIFHKFICKKGDDLMVRGEIIEKY
jgi:hypothetical protein